MSKSNVTSIRSEPPDQRTPDANDVLCEIDRARAILNTFIQSLGTARIADEYVLSTVDSILDKARDTLDRVETKRGIANGC